MMLRKATGPLEAPIKVICIPNTSSHVDSAYQMKDMPSKNYSNEQNFESDRLWFTSYLKTSSSQSIPIPCDPHRAKKVDDRSLEDNALSVQAKRHYELATWRMYDRIVTYRQTHPFGQQYTSTKRVSTSESVYSATESLSATSQDSILDQPETAEEGIFDLEL